jgi:hypothetical protein
METFMKWSKRRLALVENPYPSPPPRLERLKVGTCVNRHASWAGKGEER